MQNPRRSLSKFFICLTLFANCAFAQSNLTQILDTVYNADKSPFNGTVIISWSGFTGSSGNTIAPHSTSAQIVNGALSVFLVPTTTASACAYYLATYNSSDGTVTWTEIWEVPPSTTPLTLSQVRQPDSGCGDGGTSGGGDTISIGDVTGLSSDLNAINGSLTALTTTVNGVSSSVTSLGSQVANLTSILNGLTSTTSVVFVDAESPSGAINGTNAVFTLSAPPVPPASLTLYRNGMVLRNGVDYTLAVSTITFAAPSVPKSGDYLEAFYRTAGTGATSKFADEEVPAGTINGTNLTFTLLAPPKPALSLKLYKNGILLEQNNDYTLSGATITFANTTVTPQSGDSIVAYYRY